MAQPTNRIRFMTGERVALAACRPNDLRLRYQDWLDPDTQRNFNSIARWRDLEEFIGFFTAPDRPPQRLVATALRLSDETPVAYLSLAPAHLEPDLGIWVFNPYRGQGYGSEAVALASRYILTQSALGLTYLVAGIYGHNRASARVFEKAGYRRVPELDGEEESVFGEGGIVQLGYRLDIETLHTLR